MPTSLEQSYDEYPRIEAEFQAMLDVSLNPRGPDMLYDIVAGLGLPRGASALDLGCGEGRQALQLAERFGFAVHGIDPVARHIELCNQALSEATKTNAELKTLVRFEVGAVESIPAADDTVDLIWCRDVLVLVEPLAQAFAECRRVLRPDGRMLIYQTFAGDRVHPDEATAEWATHGIIPANVNPDHFEAIFTTAGFQVEERILLRGEWEEYAQEQTGRAGRHLLRASRLLRNPEPYIARYGETNYHIMLGDCFWHIYQLIDKISPRVYVLSV